MTRYIERLRKLPMPLRVGALASLAVFLIAFATLATSHGQRPAVAFSIGILGLDGLVGGMVLATNYRGYAAAYAELWSVDEARRWLRAYFRVYGVVSVIGGIVFVAVSVLLELARTS